ncbi:membrane protein [Paenibacillus baekrokdamisoli]|uniref:Membrane protein n=1 Tax=Paenibacillus baekrokdamisoli TaxID=1712516 RepID=A0A3G9IU03_9BACL|nr:MBL fold metallo-hydrolase [Paenibacillus baekrokdamisoli]MBB3071624.1 L-ascorbate metabolism protein UlaG (beta-lactamase superfamily) [Paenibacillus baekrokdamisoli]BBH21866.1 membrane protein [Paenibacillus baekrokdamisoli]
MRFENLDPTATVKSFKELRQWRRERAVKMKLKDYSFAVPAVKPDIAYLQENKHQPSLTWIGHSTFLIQHSGLNIITDPVWAEKLGFQKRLSQPGLPITDIPPIDVVLISHSHYDHLHIGSLKQLSGGKTLIVPIGLADKMRSKGFSSVIELDWWESATIGGVEFTFVPSQHWTRRTLLDMNRSHWGGYIINSSSEYDVMKAAAKASITSANTIKVQLTANDNSTSTSLGECPTIYFAGDSGYFDGFKQIGERFRIDIALMPIGAYDPEWFMGPQHVTPEQALQAFEDTGAGWFVPMHYGSFRLADDTPREALDRLEAERAKRQIVPARVVKLQHGETWRLNEN